MSFLFFDMWLARAKNCLTKPVARHNRRMSTPLKQLQQNLKDKNLAAYIVPSEDPHQSEYTPEAGR